MRKKLDSPTVFGAINFATLSTPKYVVQCDLFVFTISQIVHYINGTIPVGKIYGIQHQSRIIANQLVCT
jgi:hypothetical protein